MEPIEPPSFDNQPLSEQTADFQNYVFRGGQLIIAGRFPDAISHFRNKIIVERNGLRLTPARDLIIDSLTPSEVDTSANIAAMNSWFKEDKSIEVSGVWVGGRDLRGVPIEKMTEAERNLAHELALVHMEEFLHATQYLRGTPLTGYADAEIDVAAYMLKNNIPMTAAFLRRYDRGAVLLDQEGDDDSTDKTPSLRRGVFVRVKRSSGQVEENWQVKGFDPSSGDALIVNYQENIERQMSKGEFAALNETGVHPFSTTTTFEELFKILDSLRVIHGTNDVYGAGELKESINQVRSGRAKIEQIPRSGGLRMKVATLAGINLNGNADNITTRVAY